MFEQATIKVEKEKEFAELQRRGRADFLQRKGRSSCELLQQQECPHPRTWDAVLAKGLIERADEALAKAGDAAKSLYESLTVADQGQLREFYLAQIEKSSRHREQKFQKIYRYY